MDDNTPTVDQDATRATPSGPPAASTGRAFEPGAMVAGRYRLVALLGRGGMGEVYRAEDLTLDQPIALKFLPVDVANDAPRLASFHNELRVARQVSHKNVCRLHDLGEASGRRFLTMEYVDGEDLASLLRRVGRVPEERALQMARQLCAGTSAAHERGVIHRDLKPANVMIDSAGDVRITDFGIATAAGHQGEGLVGTPHYMAPEQLTGQPASPASDIYALGLILFELFTGRRAIDGRSLADLQSFHKSGTITTPSSIVKDLDPAIERVILRCLDRDPARRPASALAVAAALPGGDPLAAALAAGETPSPELLAAAAEADALPLGRGLMLAAVCLVGLALFAVMSPQLSIPGRVPFDLAPAVLVDRAERFLSAAGYEALPGDSAWDFVRYDAYTAWLIRTRPQPDRWQVVRNGNPSAVLFWYRSTPRLLEPQTGAIVTEDDPPLAASGERLVGLDTRGRLRIFRSVPPARLSNEPAAAPPWRVAFEAAALDFAAFTPTSPEWTPPDHTETLAAWEGALPESDNIRVRVEAGASRGRLTYFYVIGPWARPALAPSGGRSSIDRIIVAVAILLIAGVLAAAAVLARRHLKTGRADRRGAAHLIVIGLILGSIAWLVDAHHTFALEAESDSLFLSAGALFVSIAIIWLAYLALEPYVRRLWPDSLLGWSRLMSGKIRDPRIGRDVLAGATAGVLLSVIALGRAAILPWLGYAAPSPALGDAVHLLHGTGAVVATVLLSAFTAIQTALVTMLMLVFVRLAARKLWLSAGVSALLLSVIFLNEAGTTNTLLPLLFAVASGALLAVVVYRFGVLALIAALFVHSLLIRIPIMPNPAHWSALAGNWMLITVLAVIAFSFHASGAGSHLKLKT